MEISLEQIKTLREETGVSIGKCKEALVEANGDMEKARELLRDISAKAAAKKSDRELAAGVIQSYIHNNNNTGTLVKLSCETDYVARNEDFIALAQDIALHITAMGGAESVEELLSQPFIKNPEITIAQLIEEAVLKIGERIEISDFVNLSI